MINVLKSSYLTQVGQHQVVYDEGQVKVVEVLQSALDRLQERSFLCRVQSALFKSKQGVYIWGDVGVGKTWLMDQFYSLVTGEKKVRYHYHEFMEMLHGEMGRHQYQSNPLDRIADELAQQHALICVDEFHVTEIADAMLLYGILDGLFRRKVMLVMTSNCQPDRLYENGFHRELFLPAIELLKQHNEVVELESHTDYRKANCGMSLEQMSQDLSDETLQRIFQLLKTGQQWSDHALLINQRSLPVIQAADGVVWLDYRVICSNPRATRDYIELAQIFSAVIISNIDPKIASNESHAWRFLHFVDELYDHRIKLVISAMGMLMQDYKNKALRIQYARTVSRLYEMQGSMVKQGVLDGN